MDIRILPSNIANMIAAGEVVQRPASVVKELVENAVDAGADQVTVVIQDAGRTLIQVIDNGCGMSPDQAVLCFERHATSKLRSAEDLHNILTFGFRGEALASIASVAEVTLKTRREEDELGCKVEFADSQHISTDEVATPRGANFSVRNLCTVFHCALRRAGRLAAAVERDPYDPAGAGQRSGPAGTEKSGQKMRAAQRAQRPVSGCPLYSLV